jgi:hypothetical protein
MQFDLKSFIKTILIFVVLSVVWTYFSVITDRFTKNDKGMLTGLGYLVIFASSIYFGRKLKFFDYWLMLILFTVIIFCLSSFVFLPGLFFLVLDADVAGWIIYTIGNSIFVAWALTLVLQKFYGLQNRKLTMIITAISALASYGVIFWITEYAKHAVPDYVEDIHGMFNIFQLFLIVPLAAGLSMPRKAVPAAA